MTFLNKTSVVFEVLTDELNTFYYDLESYLLIFIVLGLLLFIFLIFTKLLKVIK